MLPFVQTRICLMRTFPDGVAQQIDAFRHQTPGHMTPSLHALRQSGMIWLKYAEEYSPPGKTTIGRIRLQQCSECHELLSMEIRYPSKVWKHYLRCACKRRASRA